MTRVVNWYQRLMGLLLACWAGIAQTAAEAAAPDCRTDSSATACAPPPRELADEPETEPTAAVNPPVVAPVTPQRRPIGHQQGAIAPRGIQQTFGCALVDTPLALRYSAGPSGGLA